MRLDWDRLIAAWALVLVLILGCSAAVQVARPIDRAEAHSALWGAKIPQYDPFNLGPSAFESRDSTATQVDD